MHTTTLHAPPHWTAVARRQHLLLIDSGRAILLIAACLIPLFFVDVQITERIARRASLSWDHSAVFEAFGYLLLISAGWALLIWRDETRQRRRYHWAMPVSHSAHDLWRVTAGAIILTVALAIYCLVGAFVTGRGAQLSASEYGAPFWINMFTAPLIIYLAISILPLLTDRSLEWALGIIASLAVLSVATVTFNIDSVMDVFESVVGGPYGLAATLLGGIQSAHHEIWVAKASAVAQRRTHIDWTTTEEWLIATSIWSSIVVLGLVLALRKRP